jgi:F-type H+-transporting ATPase subunit delta
MYRVITKRRFATEAQKLIVNFAVPHQAILSKQELIQVNLSSTDGDMGILHGHVPMIVQLKPSVLSLVSSQGTTKYFVSGGFATMNPDSTLNINAVEACLLQELDFEQARKELQEAQKLLQSEQDKVVGQIQVEVLEAVLAAQKQ